MGPSFALRKLSKTMYILRGRGMNREKVRFCDTTWGFPLLHVIIRLNKMHEKHSGL